MLSREPLRKFNAAFTQIPIVTAALIISTTRNTIFIKTLFCDQSMAWSTPPFPARRPMKPSNRSTAHAVQKNTQPLNISIARSVFGKKLLNLFIAFPMKYDIYSVFFIKKKIKSTCVCSIVFFIIVATKEKGEIS